MGRKKGRRLQQAVVFLAGLLAGGSFGLMGIQCLEPDGGAGWRLRPFKAFRHAFRLFLWAAGIAFLAASGPVLLGRMGSFEPGGTVLFIALTASFVIGHALPPGSLRRLLPGFKAFLCPQCFHESAFRFQPVSPKFGLFVTYLCGRCSCLVDAWGNQILGFLPVSGKDLPGLAVRTAWFSALAVAAGVWVGTRMGGQFF